MLRFVWGKEGKGYCARPTKAEEEHSRARMRPIPFQYVGVRRQTWKGAACRCKFGGRGMSKMIRNMLITEVLLRSVLNTRGDPG